MVRLYVLINSILVLCEEDEVSHSSFISFGFHSRWEFSSDFCWNRWWLQQFTTSYCLFLARPTLWPDLKTNIFTVKIFYRLSNKNNETIFRKNFLIIEYLKKIIFNLNKHVKKEKERIVWEQKLMIKKNARKKISESVGEW